MEEEIRSSSEDEDAVMIDRDDVTDYNEENILPVSPEDMKSIRKWLEPTDFDADNGEFRKHLHSHLDGTGQWLFSTSTYHQWHDSPEHGMLWIKGIPGSGKSVFAASLVQRFQSEDVPVLYFFFRQIIDANHAPAALLRDWLAQVLRFSPPLQARLQEYMEERELESLSLLDLFRDLRLALTHLPKVYCVIDALDEMDQGNTEFLQLIAELGQWQPAKVKVLITSRPVASVEVPLRPFHMLQTRLDERLVDEDIAVYVQHRLASSAIAPADRELIRRAVPGRANGLFLYAKLAMDSFLEPGADIHEVLKLLPTDLNTMYTDLLREHARRSTVPDEVQLLILQWVTHATRPLRLLEIAEMINTTSNRGGNLKATKDLVRAACGPLLEILPDETVCPVHHSLTEFLKGSTRVNLPHSEHANVFPILQNGPTHLRLALACLQYLQSGPFAGIEQKTGKQPAERGPPVPRSTWGGRELDMQVNDPQVKIKHPFVQYAATNWYTHASRSALDGVDQAGLSAAIDSFLQNPTRDAWLHMCWTREEEKYISPLHIAARCGLTAYAQYLVDSGVEIDPRDEHDYTPLFWASENGHTDVVKLLVDSGANPDVDDAVGLKPLHAAARLNHAGVAMVLLNAGVSPLTPKTKENPGRRCGNATVTVGHTPLMYACQNGHVEVVDVFLPFLKDVETVHRALAWATNSAHFQLVERIVRHPGVDVNAKVRGDTPLFNACKSADVKSIEILLKAGADPNAFNNGSRSEFAGGMFGVMAFRPMPQLEKPEIRGNTALHALCGCVNNHSGVDSDSLVASMRALLDAGANVHQRTSDGRTPLHWICTSDKFNSAYVKSHAHIAVRFLLDAGADPNTTNDSGDTPLHGCAATNLETVKVLIEYGANINQRGSSNRTPLLALAAARARGGPEAPIGFFEFQPDCNVVDDFGDGPLHLVCREDRVSRELIEALLRAGADPNLRNLRGQTPIHLLKADSLAIYKCMVEAGADLAARDNAGKTVLSYKIMTRYPVVKPAFLLELVDLGADLHARDFKGRSLLYEAVGSGNLKLFSSLVENGLDPSVVDNDGNTLWHELVTPLSQGRGADKFKAKLVELSVDPDQANHSGQTPLHVIFGRMSYTVRGSTKVNAKTLQFMKNVQPADHDGITPLHIAATLSEAYVSLLIGAGADPSVSTVEGLTPLHIAARSRQSNTVGLLLQALKRLAVTQGKPFSTFLEATDKDKRTPLHHACRSGRPESVALLLEAGANVNALDGQSLSPLLVCGEFEQEKSNWGSYGRTTNSGEMVLAGSAKLHDPLRTSLCSTDGHPVRMAGRNDNEQASARVEEILDMLLAHGANTAMADQLKRNYLFVRYDNCRKSGHNYTAEAFRSLYSRIFPDKPIYLGMDGLECMYLRDALPRAFREAEDKRPTHESSKPMVLNQFLGQWQYSLVVEACRRWDYALVPDYHGTTPLHTFAKSGFARLIQELGTVESVNKIDDPEWQQSCEEASDESKRPVCTPGALKSLLSAACSRELPNMEVVKLLVEDFGVNVNAQRKSTDSSKQSKTALHIVADGKHWWQVAQAIPYLVERGADLEARDESGRTPLQVALRGDVYTLGHFHKEAAQELLRLGADVNAVDSDGRTCLALAGNNVDIIRLLISHGAKVTAPALFAAIHDQNADVLDPLLSNNADPNARYTLEEVGCSVIRNCNGIPDHEWYPVHYAAVQPRTNDPDAETLQKVSRMVSSLLRAGADPYASFENPQVDHTTQKRLGKQTVFHSILAGSGIVTPFLEFPDLDLERRDQNGSTPLLLACGGHRGPNFKLPFRDPSTDSPTTTMLEFFMDRKADLAARDNSGKNVLHRIISQNRDGNIGALRTVISKLPELVHQQDSDGDTPFHKAVAHIALQPEVVMMLLDAGADPLQPDSKGDTPLHKLAGWLLNRNRHLSRKAKGTEEGSRSMGAEDFFKLFLDRGVSINAPNTKTGDTPLFELFRNQSSNWNFPWGESNDGSISQMEMDAIKVFEDAGADFFARNKEGDTLLHVVARAVISSFGAANTIQEGKDAVVARFKYLMEKGLDPMIENEKQQTSLDLAAALGHGDILKLFERRA